MKNDLSCKVVRDLLPSYLDELTCEETNQAVEMHLKECEECTEVLNRMRAPEGIEPEIEQEHIDYLKKIRKNTNRNLMLGIISAAVILVAIMFINAFLIGKNVDNPNLVHAEVNVDEQGFILNGYLLDSGKGVEGVEFRNENGIVKVTLKETLVSNFHSNDFYTNYACPFGVKEIWIGDRIIWDHGRTISPEAAELFRSKHLYIGGMPQNGKSSSALGLYKDLGNFTNELQTSEEPYGWKLIGEENYSKANQGKLEMRMKSYGSALIAVIDNLGYVTFEYKVDGEPMILTITEKDADSMAGGSVKKMAETPRGLQELLIILNLSDGYIVH